MNKILEIKDLTVDFLMQNGSFRAVDNVSFDIYNNEIFGLVGESGSGKSTIVKAILRILTAPGLITDGQILYNKDDILLLDESSMSSLRWKSISIVNQKALNSLNPLLKIKNQILDTIHTHISISETEAMNQCNELMDMVDLDRSYLNSFPHELSGGMRQRVVIAIALILEPDLIIMDEPTTALDVVTEKKIIMKILELKKKLGFSILFITHDLELILEFADRVGVMQYGELVDLDYSKVIKSGGNHEYSKKLIDSIPLLEACTGTNKDIMIDPIITVTGLTKIFQKHSSLFSSKGEQVLNDISFDLNKNEIIGLVGESGSGKSTIAKILTKLLVYEGGMVKFNGVNLSEINGRKNILKFRKTIQMVFQDPFASLNSIHTVYSHLSRSILIHRSLSNLSKRERKMIIEKEMLSILSEVGLSPPENFIYKFPHEMSGGERQRISLARALIANPQVIIADEPTSMLDMSIRMGILDLFLKLKKDKKISIIFITHDIASACYISDRIIILKKGKIVDSGPSNKIINNPSHSYSKLLIDSCTSGWFTNQ